MLTVALKDLFYSLEVALITGLKKLFFLFLLFSEVSIPHFFHHLFEFWQLINTLKDFIYFILLINELDLIFVKILDCEDDIIFVEIFRLVFIVEKTGHVVLRGLQLTFLETDHVTHGHLLFDLGVFELFDLTQILHLCGVLLLFYPQAIFITVINLFDSVLMILFVSKIFDLSQKTIICIS